MIVHMAGVEIEVDTADADVREAVASLATGSEVELPYARWPGEGTPGLRIVRSPGGFRIEDELAGTREARMIEGDLTALVTVLEPRLALAGTIARPEFPLHAAGVVVDGSAVLALGDSGSGKSSIALAWALAGHPILGDDQVLVDPDGSVRAFPRLLKVDRDRAAAHGLDPSTTRWYHPAEREVWYSPEELGTAFAPGSCTVRCVAHVRRDPGLPVGTPARIERLSPAESVQALLLGRGTTRDPDANDMDRVVRLAENAVGLRVVFADASDAAERLIQEVA